MSEGETGSRAIWCLRSDVMRMSEEKLLPCQLIICRGLWIFAVKGAVDLDIEES